MSLAVADKLLRAFEALKNYKDGTTVSDPNVTATVKKKESPLSKKDRISNLNIIGDLTCSPLLRNLGEFGKLIAVSIETLLSFCNDDEPDVRLVASDGVNRIIKGFMDANVARVHVELYKEIKRNGNSRCLRAALSKFAEICFLIRPHKCRPFITNLLPCLARICSRTEEPVQETLAAAMKKIMPVLGAFMNDKETKILLKMFLQNVSSSSATTRRTAASSITMICLNARKPAVFFSWTIDILLESMLPFTGDENSAKYCGALLCLRHIVPHLGNEVQEDEVVMRGSFGVFHQQKRQGHEEMLEKEEKQFIQTYKLIMLSTKHFDHNVVTSGLEALQHLLQSPPSKLLYQLLSDQGLVAYQDHSDDILSSTLDDIDTLSFTSQQDSGVEEPLGEAVDEGDDKEGERGMTVADIQELRRHFSQSEEEISETVTDTASEISENCTEGSLDADNDSGLGHHRSESNTSGNVTRASSTGDLTMDDTEQIMIVEDNQAPEEGNEGVDKGFTIDPVECYGVPILHCARVMCSFLLSGQNGEILSDRKVRVSVKSLALNCLAAIFNIYPQAFLARVVPDMDDESNDSDSNQQLIREVLLYQGHHDPVIRGSLALLLANFLQSSLVNSWYNFQTWSVEMCKKYKTDCVNIDFLVNVIEKLVVDESSVTVRMACLGVKECFSALCMSSSTQLTLKLCLQLVQLKHNSYWLVKVELLQIIGKIDFSLIAFLESQESYILSEQATQKSFGLQETFFRNVVLELLTDNDPRVRSEAVETLVKLVQNMFFENVCSCKGPLLAVAKKSIGETLGTSSGYNNSLIKTNLAKVVTSLSQKLNVAVSKHALLGYCEALCSLSKSYPVPSWPICWSCDVHAITRSPSPTGKTGFPGNVFPPVPPPGTPQVSSILCNNGGGSLSLVIELMTSSWLTFNLQGHEDALLLVGNLLLGIASSSISLGQSDVNPTESPAKWSVFSDPAISVLAEKVFVHVLRLLNICFHVIDNVSPGAHSSKPSLISKDKDKSSTPIPGSAVPSSNTTTTSVSSPKKLLNRSRKNTEVSDTVNVGGDKGSTGKSSETDGKSSTAGTLLGQFHHLPHYYQLYEVIKGVFSNYKVNLKFQDDEKFVKLLKTTLTVFSILLELVTFSDVGKNVEEIIGYLQAAVKCEAATAFLCVQQMLRAIFGVNVATQPENSSSNSPQQKDALITEILLPHCLETSIKSSGNIGFYQSYYGEFQDEINRAFDEIRKSDCDEPKENRSFKDFGFIKKLRQRRGSFRPPLKVDKQVHIHSYIRMFEPLVIQALKEYTSSSDIQVQAQVLSILVQLIRLRVNYALLDSEQAFLNFVVKQFEFIEAGQIRHIEAFSPHIFQFLILLSYDCFQPKFNQAKSVFGMSRIIQVCDDLMACGQSARTHAIPALCPIVYDLFDPQVTGRNENSKELETQREVFITMLLRLAQFPEVLSLLVYVLTFYRKNDEKWKKFSRQAVDVTLQLLIKQQVMVDDIDGLKCLENLFDSVAPIALRPLDVVLKAAFAPANLPSTLTMKRWLSQVLVLLKVIITQNTEENLLSRVTQLGFTGGLIENIVDNAELDITDTISENKPAKVFVHFLFHALYLAVKNSSVISDRRDRESVWFISQLTSYLLMYIQEIIRSGLFKNISNAGLSVLKENLANKDESPQIMKSKVKKIHELFMSLKETQPVLCVQWTQLVFLFGFDNDDWWINLQDRMNGQEICSVNGHISLKGTFLVRCKVLCSQIKNPESNDNFARFVRENLINIVEMSSEPPVNILLRQIHNSSSCSQVFIEVTKELCKMKLKRMYKLEFNKSLLVVLDGAHYKQSNNLIQLLMTEFLNSHYRAITKKCETMICSRLEYCMSLPKEEFEEFFSLEDIKTIHNSLVTIGVTKRNPRLSSLISHISSESCEVPTVENTINCKAAIAAVKTKQQNEASWFFSFVYNCCCCWKLNEVGIKNCGEVVHLLHALTFDEISRIMDDEKFNTSLLSPCLLFGIKKTIELYSRNFDHETPNNPFEDTTYFDSFGVDHLFQCSFGLLLRLLQEIVFSVTNFAENNETTKRTSINEISLVRSTMNSDEINKLSRNFSWKQKLLDVTKGLDVYLSSMDKLPAAARLPEAIYCAACQFGMITLEVVRGENEQFKNYCTSELTTVLRCFSWMLHNRYLHVVLNSSEYSSWVCHALRSVYCLVRTVFVLPGATLPEDEVYSDIVESDIPLKQASMLVNYLYTLLNRTSYHSFVPETLTRSFRHVITGLSRLIIFNSYVRVPPIVWKMGWNNEDHGAELPPLPINILREKDVLQDFVLRVHSIGWISRQQFEETWAALLGVLSSPLSPEQTSREEDIDSIKSGCLALQCITALLLQTTLYPLPGNPSAGTNLHTSRQKELPFLDSRAGRKLCAVRKTVEGHFIEQCPQSLTWHNTLDIENLYGRNIERVSGLHSYSLGQICISSLQAQCVPVDSNNVDETNPSSTSPTLSTQDKIDVRSCVQFLMELFERWVSLYTHPKTPLMLLTQSVKSLLIISDLFVDCAQYEWMLSELLDVYQNYPNEDEIMMQYLLPSLCKALAVLKMEGVIPEKIVKMIEVAFKAPHVPLQVSGLYGSLYLLESHISSVVNLVIPLVTDYVMKILNQVTDSSVFGEHRLLVLLSISFYLLEHYENEITDVEFKNNFLKTVITMASSGDENIPLHLYHAITRGLERLVVSFSLSREDSDSLVKFSIDRLAMRNPQKAISALGLLLTCMYTGKEGVRPSGLFQENETVDTPTDDVLLVALERVTSLFDRIRKGFRSEAKLVAEILPVVLDDFFPPTDVMNKVIGEFLSSQQPHPELMASVLCKVCEQLISKGQQSSVKDWILLSLSSFTQRPPLGMAVWSFTCVFISASTNKWIRALFQHVVSRIGKLETIDRTFFLITATDFYHNQNLTDDEKKSFISTFEKVAHAGTPYADLIQNLV